VGYPHSRIATSLPIEQPERSSAAGSFFFREGAHWKPARVAYMMSVSTKQNRHIMPDVCSGCNLTQREWPPSL
jgi:hypothetical protein